MTHRYKLTIEYDGTPFVGWQRQDNGLSVQGRIEDAIAGIQGEMARVNGAGRTDAGVHATGQVAHIDLKRAWDPGVLRNALNAHLRPEPVAILEAEAVPDTFDARFSARGRQYLYRIIDRRAPLAIDYARAWHWPKRLDTDAMHEAAQRLIGTHDFSTFRASNCQAKSPIRTLERLDVSRHGDVVELRVAARSFLHNQVRSMAGSLKQVGEGRWSADDLWNALQARDRTACGVVAPAWGLYLTGVSYPSADPSPNSSAAKL